MSEREILFESKWGKVWRPDADGNFTTMGAGHLLCCDLAKRIIKLEKQLREAETAAKTLYANMPPPSISGGIIYSAKLKWPWLDQ